MSHLVDHDAERGVIAAVLVAGERTLDRLLEIGVREHHFSIESLSRLWAGATGLRERGMGVDRITLADEVMRLGGIGNMDQNALRERIDGLTASHFSSGAVQGYAEKLIDLAEWRDRERAMAEVTTAIQCRDREAYGRALGSLETAGDEHFRASLSPTSWADEIYAYLTAEPAEGFVPMPFEPMNEAMGGGLQAGEVMTVAGYTNHGKSIWADMMLDQAAATRQCHLYMTEMTAAQRGLRLISRNTGIPFHKLRGRKLTEREMAAVLAELKTMPYGVTIASGWTIEDVVRDALRARHDFVVIDLIHGFDYADEAGMRRITQATARLARMSTTREGHGGTAVVQVAHLSNVQMKDSKSNIRPKPGMHSLKASSSIQQDSDFVCFVWQQDDDDGIPTGEGEIYVPKARSGDFYQTNVRLNTRRFRFEPS